MKVIDFKNIVEEVYIETLRELHYSAITEMNKEDAYVLRRIVGTGESTAQAFLENNRDVTLDKILFALRNQDINKVELKDVIEGRAHPVIVKKVMRYITRSSINEAPKGLYYIKVPRRDKAQLNAVQNTIETIYHPTRFTDIVDDDGAGNVILYFPKEAFDPGMIEDLEEDGVNIHTQTNFPKYNESPLNESEDKPQPEDPTGNPDAGPETVLEDATDTMLEKFPTLKKALVKLMTDDFKEFVDTVDWVSPRPTSFRINLVNGQDFTLKWTGKNFEAQIQGKRYFLGKVNEFQQALDRLAILYQQAPLKGAGVEDMEAGAEGGEADFGGDGSGGEFPGEEPANFEEPGAGEEPVDTTGNIDFEAGEEPEV